ncbi:endonuclease NucS domain-containing protein [Ponticoccus alexandrii]|uniref:endonuclease NucS domain-containing protein n=1 Tax=Ponticoccus alexandrii TaxID=1943633 RepID=UPI0003D1C866|nr:endonuclease NucS domain-containing protein [Ponticoccus alexandrii]
MERQGYADNTRLAQMHRVGKVEQAYGSLEDHVSNGTLSDVIDELTYTTEDERHGRPNPSQLDFNGNIRNNLASYKNAAQRYARFLSETEGLDIDAAGASSEDVERSVALAVVAEDGNQKLALERDMQQALRRDIASFDPGLRIVDGGAERRVESGFIDILCEDPQGRLTVVEFKAGKTDARVIAQTLGYMGDLMAEEPGREVKGVIIAHDFDSRTVAAARAIPNVELATYAVSFTFQRMGTQ